MPSRTLTPCSYPGCPTLVHSGYCATHHTIRSAEISYHNPEAQRLYSTTRWQRIRAMQLGIQPWCADCLTQGIYTPATDVDHVTPHQGDPIAFYSGELQSLCKPCHSRKTAGEVRERYATEL